MHDRLLQFLTRLVSSWRRVGRDELAADRNWFLTAVALLPLLAAAVILTAPRAVRWLTAFGLPADWGKLAGLAVLPVAGILTLVLAQAINHRRPLAERLGWRGCHKADVAGAGVVLGLVLPLILLLNMFSSAVFELCRLPVPLPVLQTWLAHADWWTVGQMAVMAVVVAPVVEEIVFRRLVFTVVGSYFGAGTGMVAASLLFAAVHDCSVQMPALFLLGMLLQLLFLSRRSLAAPILLHMGNNALAVGLLVLARLCGWYWVLDM
ncbi:MAG: CPBP family intramembrane metalloprotease [Victivallales bacterium]|nr:CPBP family intramembrane metalloprotease [Victivallales bacterium]